MTSHEPGYTTPDVNTTTTPMPAQQDPLVQAMLNKVIPIKAQEFDRQSADRLTVIFKATLVSAKYPAFGVDIPYHQACRTLNLEPVSKRNGIEVTETEWKKLSRGDLGDDAGLLVIRNGIPFTARPLSKEEQAEHDKQRLLIFTGKTPNDEDANSISFGGIHVTELQPTTQIWFKSQSGNLNVFPTLYPA